MFCSLKVIEQPGNYLLRSKSYLSRNKSQWQELVTIVHPVIRLDTIRQDLLHKHCLRHHYVDSFIAVDQFGNVYVAGDAGEHVSIIAGHVFGVDEEINHLTHGDARGLMQLRMKAHADVMRGRLSA